MKFKIILNIYKNGPTEPPKPPNEYFIQSLKLGFGAQGRACTFINAFLHGSLLGAWLAKVR